MAMGHRWRLKKAPPSQSQQTQAPHVPCGAMRFNSAMTSLDTPEILISEVGPRDGLQSVKATMPTADKLRWIDALAAAGLREIEVASFVPAQLLPQMADAAQVVQHALRHSRLLNTSDPADQKRGVTTWVRQWW